MVRVTSSSQSERGRHQPTQAKGKGHNVKNSTVQKTGFEPPYQAPWRKSTRITQQAVTLVTTTHRDKSNRAEVPKDLDSHPIVQRRKQSKPQQLLWAYRLAGLRAMRANPRLEVPPHEEVDADEYEEGSGPPTQERSAPLTESERKHAAVADSTQAEEIVLPAKFKPAIGSESSENKVPTLASIVAQLGNKGVVVAGQTVSKRNLDNHPAAYIMPEQPLIQPVVVTDEDIKAQEKQVLDTRRRLEEAIKHFG